MSVQKIDYEDKIGLQNDENIPNKNKVTDEDMNEIKSKVNNNADELTTAQQNIKGLQSDQSTASGDITSLKNRVTTLEKDNTKNKADISNLKSDNEANKKNIANKVDKIEGKGLSTEDYTTAEKEKLAGLKNYDDTEIKQDIQDLKDDVSDIKSEQESQNDLLQRTQSALINITTEKSSNINVQDASGQNAKINVFGNSIQNGEPTPKAPVNIENVTGNIDITDCNKNLLNWNKIITDSQNTTNEGEYIKFYQSANRLNIKDVFKENTQYAFTIIAKKDTANGIFQLYFSYTDGSTETIRIVCTNANTDYKQTFISQANKTIDFIQSTYTDETASYIKIEGTQLEANNVATDFIAHEEQLITFPLAQGQKLYKGDYPASDGIHHVRKQVELDGTEAVMDSGSNATTHHFTITFDDKKIGQHDALSNMFINSTVATLVYSLVENPSLARITFKMPLEYTTVDSFKTFLAQQKQAGTPVIVEYELAEEEIEPYAEEQQEAYNKLQNVLSYYNVTNVFTDKALLVFKYIADTKTYVDNEINSIKNQLNTINELLSTTTTSAMLLDNMQSDLESEVL